MLKTARIFLFFLIISFLPGQTIIDHPAQPENPRASRVVTLEEVSRITDEGGKFYFHRPHKIHIAPNGVIIVEDWDQLLLFDQNETFRGNLFKKGEGPGEMQYLGGCLPTKNYLIVHSSLPSKIMWFDYQGKLIKEMRLKVRARFLSLLLFYNSRYYFYQFAWPAGKKETEIIDLLYKIVSISTGGEEFTTLASFPVKTLVARSAGGGGLIPLAQFLIISLKGRYLCLTHTSEYLIKVFDARAGKVVRQFRRRYSRVKWDKKKKRPTILLGPNKKLSPPARKYENDIYHLLSTGEHLWVITSQREKDKGVLIDVFDVSGRYLDCFYLKLPQKQEMLYVTFTKMMAVAGEYLYSLESEADLPLLKKYRLVNLK